MRVHTIYLVDCENVGFMPHLVPDGNLVYYFNRSFIDLGERHRNERYYGLGDLVGHNALDFYIGVSGGILAQRYGKRVEYIFISRDKGFDNIVKGLRAWGYKSCRFDTLPFRERNLVGEELYEQIYRKWVKSKHRKVASLGAMLGMDIKDKARRKLIINKYKKKAIEEGYING